MDLTEHLDRLRATLDRIGELQRTGDDRGLPSDHGARAAILLDRLARLQRQSGWAMRAAVEQARAAGVPWESLATHAQAHVTRLTGQFEGGGRIVVDDHRVGAARGTARSNGQHHMPDRASDDPLRAVERQLAVVDERLREAGADAEALRRIHDNSTEPEVAGRAAAYRTLTHNRWSEALGARAQLEALYQELAGAPSSGHAASSRILEESGLRPNPVGLGGRDAATAAFLRECDGRGVDDPPARARPDRGLEL